MNGDGPGQSGDEFYEDDEPIDKIRQAFASGVPCVTARPVTPRQPGWDVDVFVGGTPRPQGSKKAVPIYLGRGPNRVFTGRVSQVEMSRHLKDWRDDIATAVRAAYPRLRPIERALPVALVCHFTMPRPLRAPKWKVLAAVSRPDADKCARSVCDALTGIVFVDDSQVTHLDVRKRVARPGERAGVRILARVADLEFS